MIVIKKATEYEMTDILKLNTEIFSYEQGIPTELIPVSEDNNPVWWYLADSGNVIGSLCLWNEADKTHMGRFAVHKEYRGQHLGTGFAKFVLENLFASGISEVYLEARDKTVRIMQRLGAEIIGEPVEFYKGTVTPLVIDKANFDKSNGCCCGND